MKSKNIILIIVVVLLIFFVFPSYSQHANQMPAHEWMGLNMEHRVMFCFGFMAGFNEFANTLGVEIRRTGSRSLNALNLEENVYKHLLKNPELRSGPIGAIIMNIMSSSVIITDRMGKPLKKLE